MHDHSSADTMAREIGITQRVVFKILKDLENEGYITRKKIGRCNHYEIHPDVPMRHKLDRARAAGEILPSWISEQKSMAGGN
jgi:predicted transcriptional regulator